MNLLHQVDYLLANLVQKLPRTIKPVMSAISFSGEPIIVLAFSVVGYAVAFNRGDADIETAFIFCALAYGINTLLKQVLRRRRPHNLRMTTLGIKSYSFPSGHAFGAMIFYGFLAYLANAQLNHPAGALIALVLIILIGLIGISRVYLKTHYPTDVIAGWILGWLSLYIIVSLVF
jgi:membrane-associated phospholipid phosphatase